MEGQGKSSSWFGYWEAQYSVDSVVHVHCGTVFSISNFQEYTIRFSRETFEFSVSILSLTKSVLVLYFNSAVPEQKFPMAMLGS